MYKAIHSPGSTNAGEGFEKVIISESERIKPMVKEQLLRELIIGTGDINEILHIYCRAFDVNTDLKVRLAIIKPSGIKEFEDFFFVKNTVQQYIGKENMLLVTVISDFIVVATTLLDRQQLGALLDKIRSAIKHCYNYNAMAIYSDNLCLADLSEAFERLAVCLGYSFYAESDRTLYENEIKINKNEITFRPDYGAIEKAVKAGDADELKVCLDDFFEGLREAAPLPAVATTYCLEMYASIVRCCGIDRIGSYMNGVVTIQEAKTLSDIQSFIEEKSVEITQSNTSETKKVYSSLVRDTIDSIDRNIENENLSLRWLAGTILFTNVDYLGKLFKKETGKNFSHYVMEKRMEMAKTMILEGKKDRIYEIAENVGYGSNSQYFSQVFKKYTGVSPLEYKEFAKLAREKGLPQTSLEFAQR